MTPTACWADIVLPAASCWERPGLQAGFMVSPEAESWIQLRPALVPAPGEAKSDTWMVFELAKRLGLSEQFFGGDSEGALAHVLAPAGLTPQQLRDKPRGLHVPVCTHYRKHQTQGFATPSKRVELWSERLRQQGFDPLPAYVPPLLDPAFPFLLTCGKVAHFCHSQQRNLESLRRAHPEPRAEVALDVAARRGIVDGQWISIQTPTGCFQSRARLTADLAAGTIWAEYGWWNESESVSYNAAMDGEAFDPVSGSNALRGVACDVRPMQKESAPMTPAD